MKWVIVVTLTGAACLVIGFYAGASIQWEEAMTWREGARSGDAGDKCPNCGATGCVFASDFKVFGSKKSVRACAACKKVSVNGKVTADLIVTPPIARVP